MKDVKGHTTPRVDSLTEILEAYAAGRIDSRSAMRRARLATFVDLLEALRENNISLRRTPTASELAQAEIATRILRENLQARSQQA